MMINVEVLFTPAEFATLPERDLTNTACVVFDVLRATSSMVTALAHDARAIFPTEEIEDALALKRQQPNLLLAGERHGLRITAEDGTVFDFGNSPREFCTDRISGRTLAMTTTNGTRALLACRKANVVLIASFLNLAATARKLVSIQCQRLLLVCGGTFEEAAYEDVLCAGTMIDALVPDEKPNLADSALLAWKAWRLEAADLSAALKQSRNGCHLLENPELRDDIEFCAQRDCFGLVARLEEDGSVRKITDECLGPFAS